ncbi:hypothetical protein M9H77_31181 [Catharanthus roseus]|uniref:Uncharacterized protein n=1 Tax=Catharanthus roseus TaxID=4058 RepID=A0ACB9ZZP1_CATRO|nr:hypothetical protein M9H77_31181 [Catharanthus roseus]
MLPPTIKGKARRREGDAAEEGKGFWRSGFDFFFIEKAEDSLRFRALPALSNKTGSARESACNRKEGVHVAAAPAPFLVNGAQQVRHLLQKRESTSDNHASARQRVEWPRANLFGYIIQVESRVTGTAV